MTQLELSVHEHSGMNSYPCLLPAEAVALLATKMSFSDPSLALVLQGQKEFFSFSPPAQPILSLLIWMLFLLVSLPNSCLEWSGAGCGHDIQRDLFRAGG